MGPSRPYPEIADYALIGNRHTCALLASDGSVDWCCLPHLDSPSVFAALLDERRGGRWLVAPAGHVERTRRYLGVSAILETVSRGSGGVVKQVDFLPIRRGRGDEHSRSSEVIVRIVECLEGEVEIAVEWVPRPNYALDDVSLTREGDAILALHPAEGVWLAGLGGSAEADLEGASARARVRLRSGERLDLICGWGRQPVDPRAEAPRMLEETIAWWQGWRDSCSLSPGVERWEEPILRSGVVLKLLTHERSGAIAAAPTTSLPEEIGGVRNWDYRFCWVRDASLISHALLTLGHERDAVAFLEFLERAAQQHRDPARIQVVYRLDGGLKLPEFTLGHLDGYRDSKPVRVGNSAAVQRQLDVYGELLDAASDLMEAGHPMSEDRWNWLRSVADYVCRVWRWKDRSIWEVRGPERHFTYSKLMCWVALDRALRIARRLEWEGPVFHWRREREAIRKAILEEGFDASRNSFVQSFDSSVLDASNLLIPIVGFLPPRDPRVLGTIDATLRELTENGLVHRYRTEETPDGVGGGEGAFGICTFWLSDALSLAGRVEEAREIYEGMLGRANDLGLFPEEIDSRTGRFLGNYPQAFTHVGLISGAGYLGRAIADRERAMRDGASPLETLPGDRRRSNPE
jgi:GH15 family glucan-1,4-alpha-glucosidase